VSIGIRVAVPVDFGQGDRLDHRVTLGRPIFQIPVGLLAIEAMEQLPGGVAQPEERRAVGMDEKPLVLGDLQRPPAQIGRGACHSRDQEP
jgi:hypothetical protein